VRMRREDEGGFRRRVGPTGPIKEIEVNNPEFLRQFLTEHGKIIPARLVGLTAKQQREVKQGVRRCRTMGLLA
jgi:small subunit ribosomal protein S18